MDSWGVRRWAMRMSWRGGILVGAAVVAAIGIGAGAWGQGEGGRFSAADVASATGVAYPVNTTTTGMVSLLVSLDAGGGAGERAEVDVHGGDGEWKRRGGAIAGARGVQPV